MLERIYIHLVFSPSKQLFKNNSNYQGLKAYGTGEEYGFFSWSGMFLSFFITLQWWLMVQ